MSRFINLEFNDESQDALEQGQSVKDEAYYFEAANQSFQRADFERALRYYSKVLEFNPNQAAAWTGQVRALIELNEPREGKLWADKALERFPNEPELMAAKAVALGRCGDTDGGLAFSDASIEERGDTPYLWLARGDVLLARSEKRADYCFEKAQALAPQDWVVAWLIARIRSFYDQFALALASAQKALEWNPTHDVLWVQVGLCQQSLGLVGPARTSFQHALQLNPRCRLAEQGLTGLGETGVGARLLGHWRRFLRR